jgi:hypothetical protein
MNKTITATLTFTANYTLDSGDVSPDNIDNAIGDVKWTILNQVEEMFYDNAILDNITITVE